MVVLGRRLLELTLNLPTAAEAAYPLLLQAQRAIVSGAAAEAARCEVLWAAHEKLVVAAQERSKNRRKAPSSRLKAGSHTKSEEELALDAIGAPIKVLTKNKKKK